MFNEDQHGSMAVAAIRFDAERVDAGSKKNAAASGSDNRILELIGPR